MGGRRHDVRIRHGRGVQPRRDETRDVRDVHHQVCPDLIGDLAQAGEIDDAGIRGSARDDHLRLIFDGDLFQSVVVDALILPGNAVGNDVEVLARDIDGRAVGEVPAVREVHAQNRVAGVQEREVDGGVRLRAAVRLHVGVVAAEQLFAALDGEVFHDVDVLAPAVIALAGQTLGVFVGEVRADSRHDRGGNEVFAVGVGVFNGCKIDHFPFSVKNLFFTVLL